MRLLRHRLFAPVFLFVFVFMLTVLGAWCIITSTPSAARIAEQPNHLLYSISGFEADMDGTCSAVLRTEGVQMNDKRILILSRSLISLNINGQPVEAEEGSVTDLITAYGIPVDAGNELLLTFSSLPGAAAVCTKQTADMLINGLNFGLPVFYGMLLALIISSFTMLVLRPIAMLQVFCAYLVCVFLWSMRNYLALLIGAHPALGIISSFCFDFAVVFGSATCLFFCSREEALKPITSAQMAKLLTVCIVFTTLSHLLPETVTGGMRFMCYAIGGVMILYSVWKGGSTPWFALIGLAITQGSRFSVMLGNLLGMPSCFPLLYLRGLHIFMMPFIIGCQLHISSVYDKKFSEAERLAAELSESNHLLDRKVEERTRQLKEQEQIRTNLMTNIFHDLRSPLLIMQGCMEHLNRGENEPRYLEALNSRLSFITKLT